MCKTCKKIIGARNFYYESAELIHEKHRIEEIEKKAKNAEHFRQLVLVRAQRCGSEKRARFIEILKKIERTDLAAFIEYTFKGE